MKKYKVLHFLYHFSLPSETFIYDLVTNLEKNNLTENFVLAGKRVLHNERPFNNVYVPNYLHKTLWKLYPVLKSTLLGKQYYWANIINSKKPDLINVHMGYNSGEIFSLIKEKFPDLPMLISLHGTDVTKLPLENKAYLDLLLEMSTKENIKFSVPSKFLMKKVCNLGIPGKKVSILYNSFNSSFIKNRKDKFFKNGETLKLVTCGRLINWKGHKYLIEALADFKRNYYKNTTLSIIGEGTLQNELLELIKELGLENSVNMLGQLPHSKVAEIYKEHDIYIQPSIKDLETNQEESFGLAPLEAIAVGLSVIVTNTGGLPEVVGEENDFAKIVPEKDAKAISLAIKEIMENCFSSNIGYAQSRMAKFSIFNQLNGYLDMYKKLLV